MMLDAAGSIPHSCHSRVALTENQLYYIYHNIAGLTSSISSKKNTYILLNPLKSTFRMKHTKFFSREGLRRKKSNL